MSDLAKSRIMSHSDARALSRSTTDCSTSSSGHSAVITPSQLEQVLCRSRIDDSLGHRISHAIKVIQTVLDDDQIGEARLALSFNGGKDCTVLLHLYAAVLYARHHTLSSDLQLARPANEPNSSPLAASSTPLELSSRLSSLSSSSSTPKPQSSALNSLSSSCSPSPTQPIPSPPHPPSTHVLPTHPLPYPPIKAIYITAPNPFPSLDAFVLASAERYGLDLYRFGGGMKAALESYLRCGGGKGVKAVLVGTRRGDPNGNVPELAPTDPTWPPFLRVHPILDWSYADVWSFLRDLSVPWCPLYDQGYTSLGSTTNTSPNPLLRDPENERGWLPAWRLEDESQERAGRHAPRQTN